MQGASCSTGCAFLIHHPGQRAGLGVEFNHRPDPWAISIDRIDPGQASLREGKRGQAAALHVRLQRGDVELRQVAALWIEWLRAASGLGAVHQTQGRNSRHMGQKCST